MFQWVRKLHFHNWVYTPAVYFSELAKQLALPSKRAIRKCSICGKEQERDEICLGHNPRAYHYKWF